MPVENLLTVSNQNQNN